MNTLTKTDYEKYPVSFNFTNNLKISGELITGKTVTCINADTGVSSKSVIVSDESISSPKVILVVDAGTQSESHRITVKVTTDGGNAYTKYLFLNIASVVSDDYQKIPSSEFLISNDFLDDLEDSDSLSTAIVTATKISDNSNATSTVIESYLVEDGKVFVGVMGGTNGEDYKIVIKVVTSSGYKYQKDIIMEVRNEAQI